MSASRSNNSEENSPTAVHYLVTAVPGVALKTIPMVLGMNPSTLGTTLCIDGLTIFVGTATGALLVKLATKEDMPWKEYLNYCSFDFAATTIACGLFLIPNIPVLVPPLVALSLPTVAVAAHKALNQGEAKKFYERLTKNGFSRWRSEPIESSQSQQAEEPLLRTLTV